MPNKDTEGPLITTTLKGRQVKIFLDTGARVIIIKEAALNDIHNRLVVCQPSVSNLSEVSGGMTAVLGEADKKLIVDDRSVAMTCLLVDNIRFPGDILFNYYRCLPLGNNNW